MKKILGYILSGLGIIGIALTYEVVRSAVKITIPEELGETTLMIISLAVLAVGVMFIVKSGRKNAKHQSAEVPIYHGKEIIGYRRV